MSALYSDDEILVWLLSPQPLLGGQVPLAMIAAGREGELVEGLRQIEDGVFV